MKLEDIDGDVYITESLLETLKSSSPISSSSPKYTVIVDGRPIGTLKAFKSSPPILEVEFNLSVDPGTLLMSIAGREVKIAGLELGLPYVIGEVSCNVETLRCTVKAIHIEEVLDDRREPDLRVRQVHGVDREEGEYAPAGSDSYP